MNLRSGNPIRGEKDIAIDGIDDEKSPDFGGALLRAVFLRKCLFKCFF